MASDPFAVLGLDSGASDEDVTEAYRTLAQIYHPDRYAEAPARVQAEANKRMQELNAAFQQVRGRPSQRRRTADDSPRNPPPTPRPSSPPPPPPPPEPAPDRGVHYVDGAGRFHHAGVAPLGYARFGQQVHPLPAARRCGRLDDELLQWFELQRSNANLAATQMYESWSEQEQASYAARLGCMLVALDRVRDFGVPCAECRP